MEISVLVDGHICIALIFTALRVVMVSVSGKLKQQTERY